MQQQPTKQQAATSVNDQSSMQQQKLVELLLLHAALGNTHLRSEKIASGWDGFKNVLEGTVCARVTVLSACVSKQFFAQTRFLDGRALHRPTALSDCAQ